MAVVLLLFASSAAATPPELRSPNAIVATIGEIQSRIEQLSKADAAGDENSQLASRATIHCLHIASDLLAAGDRAGDDGNISILAGLTLWRGIDAIERDLDHLLQSHANEMSRRAGVNSLHRFNDAAAELRRRSRPSAISELDTELQSAFEPLLQALQSLDGAPASSHWIAGAMEDNAPIEAPAELMDQLHDKVVELQKLRVDVKPIKAAMASLDALEETARNNSQTRLHAILERILEHRRLDSPPLPRDFRPIERELAQAYRAAEDALLKQLATLVTQPGWQADPALASLVFNHQQRVEDLTRLANAPRWVRGIANIDPKLTDRFSAQAARLCSMLLDGSKRDAALAALDAFEHEFDLFVELQFEAELRRAAPEAIKLTGGLHDQLTGELKQQRRAWAREWTESGQSGEAAARMRLLHQLLSAMNAAAAVGKHAVRLDLLNRWPAWELDIRIVARPMNELDGRLKLATAAAIQHDDATLEHQLERMDLDASLAHLAGKLLTLIGDELAKLPEGAAGVLGQVAFAPQENTRMAVHRRDFATLCRYALELEHARQHNRIDEAAALSRLIDELAATLVEAVNRESNL